MLTGESGGGDDGETGGEEGGREEGGTEMRNLRQAKTRMKERLSQAEDIHKMELQNSKVMALRGNNNDTFLKWLEKKGGD